MEQTNPGFEARNLFTFNFDIGPQPFTAERGREYLRSVLDRVNRVPGVGSVAVAANRPLAGGLLTTVDVVSPTFFDTMRIPILEGRGLTAFDRDGSARIAVVSQAMATSKSNW